MVATTTLLTFEEFERMPDQPGKQELLKGELIESPPASYQHNLSSHGIYDQMKVSLAEAHVRGQAAELGRVFLEMGYRLADSWVQPDVSVTRAGQTVGNYLEGAPAIAIEIVSPSNSAESLDTKTELYFEFGAREVWRIYPETRHVVIHLAGSARIVREGQAVTTPLVPGFAMSVSGILGESSGPS